MGKRKDGKGDGALVVDRKKLKPEEAEEGLEKAQQTFAGTCWSSKDGETVFFAGKGKKVSPMVVAKMALTAKRTAGKQYDFRVPTDEDEAAADKLGEEAPGGEIPPAPPAAVPPPPPPPPPPSPPGKSPDLQARLKSLLLRLKFVYTTAPLLKEKLGPLFRAAAGQVQQGSPDAPAALGRREAALNAVGLDGALPGTHAPPPPAPPPPATAESAYQARVKALTEDLKKAITSGTDAGTEAKLRFSESQVFSRKMEFKQALALLDVVEAQIKKALAGAPGANGSAQPSTGGKGAEPAAPATANGDPAAEWKVKLAEWTPAFKKAMAAKGPTAADMAKLFAQATALSKPGGDMAQALAKLTECHELATAALSATAPASPEGQAPPAADPKTAAARWE